MKDEIDGGSIEGNKREYVVCPRCRRVHYSRKSVDDYIKAPFMDEIVDCGCGLSFYAFSRSGLSITIPAGEAISASVVQAVRRFVIATGRCTDSPYVLYQDECGQLCYAFPGQDIDDLLDDVLERYQSDHFGDIILTKDMIYSIGEILKGGGDVELRKKKDGVDIIKLTRKRFTSPEKKSQTKKDDKRVRQEQQVQLMFWGGGIMMPFQLPSDALQRMPDRRN